MLSFSYLLADEDVYCVFVVKSQKLNYRLSIQGKIPVTDQRPIVNRKL